MLQANWRPCENLISRVCVSFPRVPRNPCLPVLRVWTFIRPKAKSIQSCAFRNMFGYETHGSSNLLSTSISFNETLTSDMGDDTKFWRFFHQKGSMFSLFFCTRKKGGTQEPCFQRNSRAVPPLPRWEPYHRQFE